MENCLSIIQSLLVQAWYLPAVALLTAGFYFLKPPTTKTPETNKTNPWLLALGGFMAFLAFSAAYWMLRDNAPHGFSDDVAHVLQTYLSSHLRGDSINWTNGLAGGMDRWQLPNCYPYALGRIDGLFLTKPYQLCLFVMAINVICVFIFSWKIQSEIWKMPAWAACMGAVIASLIEGYWTGKYPDAHVSNGHGFTVIIVGIYWLTRFCNSPQFWLVAVITGAFMAIGSWTPFHNLPPLVITAGLWGLIFWGKDSWIKVIKANALMIVVLMIILLPYFLAIKLLFSTTGRVSVFRPTVELANAYRWPFIITSLGIGIAGAFLNIYREKLVRQVLVLFIGFSSLPLIAHFLEISRIEPFFRWELLYAGNDAWQWMAIIFFLERIQRELLSRWPIVGLACKIIVISSTWVVIILAWMGSFWMDLISSYPSGNWKALTDTSISTTLKTMEPRPGRVVGIDDTQDTHFWGEYQGMEPWLVYTPFIDQRKTYFWWYGAMLPSLHGAYTAAWLSIPLPVPNHERDLRFPVPLSVLVNLDALRIANIDWVVSHHPLYPSPDLQLVAGQEGRTQACTPSTWSPTTVDFKFLHRFWQDASCIMKDYAYPRPFYVYHLQGALPRVYLAQHILPWPQGQTPILSQLEIKMAAQGAAFIDPHEWKDHHVQTSSGTVGIDDYHSDYMRLHLNIGQESLVVVATTLNPFWRVLVDGKRVPDLDINGFQNGFWASPGAKQAELIYCPPFRPGRHPYCSR